MYLGFPPDVPPDVGVLEIAKFAQKIEFSPLSAVYPQFSTSYPQVETPKTTLLE